MGEGSGDWATVKLTVGVTRDKLRTLVMQFFADTRVGRTELCRTSRVGLCPSISLRSGWKQTSCRVAIGFYELPFPAVTMHIEV